MVRTGILTEEDPVELLEGWRVAKMPRNPAHSFTTQHLAVVLPALLPESWRCRTQEPITLEDREPEPGGAIVRGRLRDYADRHPGPKEVYTDPAATGYQHQQPCGPDDAVPVVPDGQEVGSA